MSKLSLTTFLIGFYSVSFGQTNVSQGENLKSESTPLLLSYVSLGSHFENYNSFDIGLMKTTTSKSAIGAELGYIYNVQGLNQSIEKSWYSEVYGVKAYFYYRYFLPLTENYPSHSKTFLDLEPQFFWASFKAERIAGYSCNDAFSDCQYYQFYNSRVNRFMPGINFKIGKMYNYDPLFVTLFVGLGYRYIHESSEADNKSVMPAKMFNRRGEISDLQTGSVARLRLGLQLAYNLWR